MEANNPAVTTWLAFLLPYSSLIKSVMRNVMGYGKIPTETSKS